MFPDIPEISVFVENKKGRLAAMTKVLADNGIDLVSLSIADTTNFGILRCIVNDLNKAILVLRDAGFTVNTTDVIGIVVPDQPGGLYDVLEILNANDISIGYLYSFVKKQDNDALIMMKVDNTDKAIKVFEENGIKMVEQQDIGVC